MKVRAFLSLAALVALAAAHAATLETADELAAAMKDARFLGTEFTIEGNVRYYYRGWSNEWHVTIDAGTRNIDVEETYGCIPAVTTVSPERFRLLDRVRFHGRLYWRKGKLRAGYLKAEILCHGDTSGLPEITTKELVEGQHDEEILHLRGIVRNASRDESDPHYAHLELRDGPYMAQAIVHITASTPFDASDYLGAEVSVCGISCMTKAGLRQHLGRRFSVCGLENIRIIKAPTDMEHAPELERLADALPHEVAASGFHRAEGTVLAVWNDTSLLLQTHTGRIVRVSLDSANPPASGTEIKVLGLPVTDLYALNLIHATWQPSKGKPIPPQAPTDISLTELLHDDHGHTKLKIPYHGKPIRCSGTIQHIAPDGTFLHILSESHLAAVDTSSISSGLGDRLEVGCLVSVTGICVINADNWNAYSMQQAPMRLFIVPGKPEDIVVLSRPSRWTARRLMALLGLFAAALLCVVGWNVSLNRRAKNKGRELAAEQLAHVMSELKVGERTRLAVELHDVLSQALTGVSMQIDTAIGLAEGRVPAAAKCLGLASRTIDSCRMEIRNTIWDLRGAALDEPSMDAAIRKTLYQNLAGMDISVRFNVARETFSDNTAYTVLKIIRELASNAIRHGHATSIGIAGTIDGDKLLFSVKDNGSGFDPDLVPGISEGHFGLQGIAERLEHLNGEMKIESNIGEGTKVTVALPIPHSGG